MPLNTFHNLVVTTFTWGVWKLSLNACQKTWLQNVLQEGTVSYWQGWAEGLSFLQDKTDQQQKRLIWLKNPGEDSWLRSSSRNNTTFQYGCRCLTAVFKTEMMGWANLDLLKAFSAEALMLLSNDPQVTEGDQFQTNTSGRLSRITSSQHFKMCFSTSYAAWKFLLTRQLWMWQGKSRKMCI